MKIKNIIPACLLAMLITSCSDNFLTLPSQSSLTTTVYFKTQTDFETAVNGIYASMRDFYTRPYTGGSTQAPEFLMIGDLHSDNCRYYYNPNYRAVNEDQSDFVPQPQMFSTNWNTFYVWIARSNQVLDLIDAATFDQVEKDNLKGQAQYLRAYSYWWLTRLYGDACLHLKPVGSVEEASLALSPKADIIAQVIKDATSASTLLKNKATQTPGRVTSGSAKMLLADVYMWQKQWASAETAVKGLKTEYSLMPTYAGVFDPTNKNNAESIFEIQFSSSTSAYSNAAVYSMFPYPFSADSLKALTGISNPTALSEGEGYCIPTPELLSKYETGDKRFSATIKYVHDGNGVSIPMCIKYLHPHSLYKQTNDNMPVYRFAEALLFLAEAVNEQGGRSAEALAYLNQVRTRANLGNSTATSQAEIRAAILKERQVELAYEGKRWFDLVRTDNVQSVISAYGANVRANPLKYYLGPGITVVPTAFTNIKTVFNIPDAEKLYNSLIN